VNHRSPSQLSVIRTGFHRPLLWILATLIAMIGCSGPGSAALGNVVFSKIETRSPSNVPVPRWSTRTRPRDSSKPLPLTVDEMLTWTAGAPNDARENSVYTVNGYLRRVRLEPTGELECELSASKSSSEPRIVTSIPPTEPTIQKRLIELIHLQPGWMSEWNDDTAPHTLITGLPFASGGGAGTLGARWELRPAWMLVVLGGAPAK